MVGGGECDRDVAATGFRVADVAHVWDQNRGATSDRVDAPEAFRDGARVRL